MRQLSVVRCPLQNITTDESSAPDHLPRTTDILFVCLVVKHKSRPGGCQTTSLLYYHHVLTHNQSSRFVSGGDSEDQDIAIRG